jgi:site-specific recombinase XerD
MNGTISQMSYKLENQYDASNLNNKIIPNRVERKYLPCKGNQTLCIDISYFDKNRSFFSIIDLSFRVICGHFFKDGSEITTLEIIATLKKTLDARGFIGVCEIIHSDGASLFQNDEYLNFLNVYEIKASIGRDGKSNQVIEKSHSSIKTDLKEILSKNYNCVIEKQQKKKVSVFATVPTRILQPALTETIENYNNTRQHEHNFGAAPQHMEQALFFSNQNNKALFDSYPNLVKDSQTIPAVAIFTARRDSIKDYVENGDLKAYFDKWQNLQNKQLNTVLMQNNKVLTQNAALYSKIEHLTEEIRHGNKRADRAEQLLVEKQELKEKRRLRKKKELRETISPTDFSIIISLAQGNSFANCRLRVSLVLLYVTGLRISNLLKFKVSDAKRLFDTGNLTLSLIKNGPIRHEINLGNDGVAFLKKFRKDLTLLIKNKNSKDYLFTRNTRNETIITNSCALTRAAFCKILNKVLVEASKRLEKHIRSHSFRATVITNLLPTTPIHEVKDYYLFYCIFFNVFRLS